MVEKVVLHGITGGVSSDLMGGSFKEGFLGSAFAEAGAVSGVTPRLGGGNGPLGVLISAVIGGTAAELGGGKFANGAVTGAFSYAYNARSGGREISADLPVLRQESVDFLAGIGDNLLLGFGDELRSQFGLDHAVNVDSSAYRYGEFASFGFGAGRVAYAGVALTFRALPATASAARFAWGFRNLNKITLSGTLSTKRAHSFAYYYAKEEYSYLGVIESASRTNRQWNLLLIPPAIGGAMNCIDHGHC